MYAACSGQYVGLGWKIGKYGGYLVAQTKVERNRLSHEYAPFPLKAKLLRTLLGSPN